MAGTRAEIALRAFEALSCTMGWGISAHGLVWSFESDCKHIMNFAILSTKTERLPGQDSSRVHTLAGVFYLIFSENLLYLNQVQGNSIEKTGRFLPLNGTGVLCPELPPCQPLATGDIIKNCSHCEIKKPFSEFSPSKRSKDGYLGQCKTCTKKYYREHYQKKRKDPEWVEEQKEKLREKYSRLNHREKYGRRYRKNMPESNRLRYERKRKLFPEKIKANSAVYNDMVSGKIQKLQEGFHYHHWCYKKQCWFDTIRLHIKNHALLHRHIIYDQERMMYRNIKGILLDTKKHHIDLLKKLKNK